MQDGAPPTLPSRVSSAALANAVAPPLPMYTTPGHPDAWHRVTAPGGYEWWYFDAESRDGRTRIVAILLEGFVFHPGYLRAYKRYLMRPTQVRPPVAGDFPCAYFVIYRDGKIAKQFMTQYRPDQFAASADRPEVTMGLNAMRVDDDGNYRLSLQGHPWRVTARGPQTDYDATLEANLTFSPTFGHPPIERAFLSRAMTGAEHHWVLAAPHCRVSGTIDGEPFDGMGYHDHNYGTAPIGPGLKRWVWGRILTDEAVELFHLAEPREAGLPNEVHFLAADSEAVVEEEGDNNFRSTDWDWRGLGATLLRYPQEISFTGEPRLRDPRVVDAAPFYLRLTYDAGRGRTAFCEAAHPHRLRWPILGRMIEMSIDKRPLSSSP